MQFLRSLPVQLGIIIGVVVLFGYLVPLSVVQICYTFSVFFKEILSLILPFMVFFFVLAGILSFKRNAPLILAILLTAIFCSNAIVALLSYGVMQLVSPLLACDGLVSALPTNNMVEPLFAISLPLPVNAVHALIAAIILGLIFTIGQITFFDRAIFQAKRWIEKILTYGFIPFLPLYILGFLLKIRTEGVLACLMQQYGSAFLLIVSLQYVYLLWLFFVACGFSISRAITAIKNALPSYITAFSTMSSAAAIPISIENAQKNTGNRELANVAMPIMANVHLLGDSFGTPILALVTMLVFQGTLPDLWQYLGFVFYFCVTMFAASGVPGGGVLVMIPILKSQLGFTPEMVSIVMTIYFLLDSFGTGANVMGDGALVIIVNKILKRVGLA